jgi:hypothetical protein
VAPDDFRYLDPGLYENVGTVEVQLGSAIVATSGKWQLALRASAGGGLAYNQQGLAASGNPILEPFYFRGFLEGIARRPLGKHLVLGARAFIGAAGGAHVAAPKQRQMYFQGADPLQQLYNPFLRSRGSLLVGQDFHYHVPGGGGVRGIDPRASAASLASLNLELERTVLARPSAHLFNRVGIAAFTDIARQLGGTTPPISGVIKVLADAGMGIRVDHRIGDTSFTTRLDFPFYMSRPELAQDRKPGDDHVAFRWTFSFQPVF